MARYKFDQIAHYLNEKRMPTEADRETYIGLEHLDSGSLTVTRWGSDVDIKGQKLVMHKGDILFGRRNTYLKRAAIAPHDGLFSAHGMIWRPKEDVVDAGFFPFFVSSDYFMDEAIRISVGSLSPTINWRDLKELEFDLPDIETQRKLSTLLWAMERAKTAYKNLIAKTDELVKSQFVEMFGTFPANEHGWPVGTIRDGVNDVRYGSSRKAAEGNNGQYPYLRMNNITYGGELDLTDVKTIDIPDDELDKCSVRRGDVLFNRTNSRELVGKTCVYNRDELMVLAGFVVRVRVNDRLLPEFLSAFMNADFTKTLLLSMCKAAIGQANINATEFQNIGIYFPPIVHQQEFVQMKAQADKSKYVARQATSNLRTYGIL